MKILQENVEAAILAVQALELPQGGKWAPVGQGDPRYRHPRTRMGHVTTAGRQQTVIADVFPDGRVSVTMRFGSDEVATVITQPKHAQAALDHVVLWGRVGPTPRNSEAESESEGPC